MRRRQKKRQENSGGTFNKVINKVASRNKSLKGEWSRNDFIKHTSYVN